MKLAAATSLFATATADHWAVIVAGSSGYGNYRHQADACHAYQVLRSKGIPASNIITMAYDDVARSPSNPFSGKLFNKPDPTGPGVDVYEGCQLDYTSSEVTPENFEKVLTGKGSGKVLKSTENDEVFVTFFDHGAVGLIGFPEQVPGNVMHKKQLQDALQSMHDQKMYKKLVFYLESCESGSMFEGMDIPGVYALSAASPDQSSYGVFCASQAKVNGKLIGSCLGDLFSVNWLGDDDAKDTTKETLDEQFQVVAKLTDLSKVMQWGDSSFKTDFVSQYIGNQDGAEPEKLDASELQKSAVSARQLDLHRWFQLYSSAESSQDRMAFGREMQAELRRQQLAESAFLRFVQLAYPHDEAAQAAAWVSERKPDQPECEVAGHKAFAVHCAGQFEANSAFAMQFHRVVVHVCADVAMGLNLDVRSAARMACGDEAIV